MSGVSRQTAQRRLILVVVVALPLLLLAGVLAGSSFTTPDALWRELTGPESTIIVGDIRAPRTLGALLVGALLGLAGAITQGVFRNPLADPFLLGSASGAILGVVLMLTGGRLLGNELAMTTAFWLERLGFAFAAFLGALLGVLLTLVLARGATQTLRLLLTGLVVGATLGAASDLLTTLVPDALRSKQVFMLGNTAYLSWYSVALLAGGLGFALLLSLWLARVLDALSLGEESAQSLGIDLSKMRLLLVLVMALCTGLAVSQAGLIAFVGLLSPHLVRRSAPAPQAYTLVMSAAIGGLLLLAADVLARSVIAPMELPVGILTAVLGGGYLLRLLQTRGWA